MLHLSGAGAVAEGGGEDEPASIQRTPEEQAAYELERLERARAHEVDLANEHQDGEFPSVQHLGATGARARAQHILARFNCARERCQSFLGPARM